MRVLSYTMSDDAVVGGGFDAGRERVEGGLRACHYKHYTDDEDAGKNRTKAARKTELVQAVERVYHLHAVVKRDEGLKRWAG